LCSSSAVDRTRTETENDDEDEDDAERRTPDAQRRIMQRILILSDNLQELLGWQRALVQAGFPVGTCEANAESLLQALMPRPAEIFVLDGSGGRLTPKELRKALSHHFPTHEARVIWLATEEQTAIMDPAGGMDDFAIQPVSAAELLARVRLLVWRTHGVDGADLMVAGDLVIDQANYSVSAGGQSLELTFKEYELLRFLVSHRGRVFTREALLNQVWGYDYFGGTRTVDVHIRRIRAKLGPGREELIETVRNVGYKFDAS
jgi:DNA-binding response OmpR family regulator